MAKNAVRWPGVLRPAFSNSKGTADKNVPASSHLQQPRELAISVRHVRVAPRRERLDHVPESGEALVDLSAFLRDRSSERSARWEEDGVAGRI